MNIRSLIVYLLIVIILGFIQIFFLKNLALFGFGFGFIYLLTLLILPTSIKPIPLMVISFLMGFGLDIFYETIGMHTAAATAFAFFRQIWLKAVSPSGGYDEVVNEPSLTELGIGRFLTYAFPLIFLYSLVFFTADQWGSVGFLRVFTKSLFSSILTTFLLVLLQLLFFKQRRGI
jgi:hypothetical protein